VAFGLLAVSSSLAPARTQTTAASPRAAGDDIRATERWDAWAPIENAHVHIWSETQSAAAAGQLPQVRVWLDGRVQYLEPGARADLHAADAAQGGEMRTVVIDLQDTDIAPHRNASTFPLAFPRPGVKKVLENERVVIWDYTWMAGVPTPMHFHDKDVVVTYLADGALRSTEPGGQSVVNPHYFGFTKFNASNRTHTEELVRGEGRAIIVELKR
jgi:hypothetical protein